MFGQKYQVLNEITLSQNALLSNYHFFKKINPQLQIAPVLKANAYGHGLVAIANLVATKTSSPFICVDSLYEAYALSRARIRTPILILGYTLPKNLQLKPLPYHFSVFDFNTLNAITRFQPKSPIHLKIDTGMCRLGFTLPEIPSLITQLKNLKHNPVGLYSHLSQADDPSKITFTRTQIKRFNQAVQLFKQAGFKPKYIHLAATAGASYLKIPDCNIIRLGLGLYGLSPFGPHTKIGISQRQKLQPVLALTSHLAQTKMIKPGSQVGYGGTYTSKHHDTIGILPLGYNEGLNRGLSNVGSVTLADNTVCPIIGNVSMDMTAIKIPRTHTLTPDEPVTIISNTINKINDLYQLSLHLNTIPYTVLTGLHASIRRRVVT